MNKLHFTLLSLLSLLLLSCGSTTPQYDKRFYFKKSDDVAPLVTLLIKKKNLKKYRKYAQKHRVMSNHNIKKITQDISASSKKIIDIAIQYIGTKYRWGGVKPTGFDCSGYTKYVYKKNGINIPRNSRAQSRFGQFIQKHQLVAGDLIFFDTSKDKNGRVSHVGIYVGKGKFLHASGTKRQIILDTIHKPYFQNRFKLARRVVIN